MNTLIQKFLALFSTSRDELSDSSEARPEPGGMPLASATYLREFAQRLGLEVDDLSPAEQAELKSRLDESMDFRENNYGFLYHEVYRLGHGYSLADANRVSARINEISEEQAASAYLDYRENAVAAEALMAAGALLQKEGEAVAAQRLFGLADARRHRSSRLAVRVENALVIETAQNDDSAVAGQPHSVTDSAADEQVPEAGLEGLMEDAGEADAAAETAAETDKPAQ
ncbi:hypothetical protein ART_0393 [Arthrobacter sp. PAMC 25486]|uniref:hypothetical protein n=1 Tax=Arthrobacter sp. PAMC 25486 TaxID=1494608 RepID=UPI000535E7D0|nr:hypothetical protein [Arthrobacter sp. PAMC 25486]AIX99991.1 hypothetical protein ART_0393 [Arthrobacter sp. PAMC 25486]